MANAIDNNLESNTQETVYSEIIQNINRIETEPNTNQNQDDSPQYGLIINELYGGFVEGEVASVKLYEELSQLKNQFSPTDSIVDNSLYNVSPRNKPASQSSNLYVEPPDSLPELQSNMKCCLFEIKLRELEIGEQFASGHFGVVYRATYHTGRGDIPVAVKTLKESANPDTMVSFMTEAATLAQFSHPNVLRLIGVITVQQPWMIVTELLKTELRELLIRLKDFPQNANLPNLLFKFSCEIAAGMEYLSGINFIHRDLAARNVLVAKDMTIRVADFGMSREVISENDYYTSSGGTVPLRWTAPEAVLYKKFSEKSDVWSYGMTLFEIWTLGDKPWGDSTNEEIIEALAIGHSLPPPSGCPQGLSTVMQECWRSDKTDRPTFSELIMLLSGISIPVISPN